MGSWQGSPTTSRPPGPAGPDVAPPRPTTRPERPADALNQPRALVPRPHTCEAATAAPAGSGEPRPATTPDGGHTSCSSTHIRDRPAHRYAHCPPNRHRSAALDSRTRLTSRTPDGTAPSRATRLPVVPTHARDDSPDTSHASRMRPRKSAGFMAPAGIGEWCKPPGKNRDT